MRKPTNKSMTRKLDKICSEIIRKRDCDMLSKECEGPTQCAHIQSRTYRNTRWDLLNLLCLCASHHFWAHKNPIFFQEFVYRYLGDYKYTMLKGRSISIKRWTIPEMIELYESLKKVRDGE